MINGAYYIATAQRKITASIFVPVRGGLRSADSCFARRQCVNSIGILYLTLYERCCVTKMYWVARSTLYGQMKKFPLLPNNNKLQIIRFIFG